MDGEIAKKQKFARYTIYKPVSNNRKGTIIARR